MPAAIQYCGKLFVTIEPTAIIEHQPIVTPFKMVDIIHYLQLNFFQLIRCKFFHLISQLNFHQSKNPE